MEIAQAEYKGRPILVFKDDKRILLAFGKKKAELILNNIDRIQEFAVKAKEDEKIMEVVVGKRE